MNHTDCPSTKTTATQYFHFVLDYFCDCIDQNQLQNEQTIIIYFKNN